MGPRLRGDDGMEGARVRMKKARDGSPSGLRHTFRSCLKYTRFVLHVKLHFAFVAQKFGWPSGGRDAQQKCASL